MSPPVTRRAVLAAAAALGLAPSSARAALRVPAGGTLRLPLPAPRPAGALDPARAVDLAHAWALALVHETLARGEREGYPLLAEPPRALDPDGRAVRVELREGMTYADGAPVTAASVAAAWARARGSALGRLAFSLCEAQDPVVVESPRALRLRLAVPGAQDDFLGAHAMAPTSARGGGVGAFAPRGDGSALVRNARAPVGAAFLERVELLAASARNDEVRAFATGATDASWRAAGLYEVRRAAREARRSAEGGGAVVAVLPTPRGALDRRDAGRAMEAALAPLAAGSGAALAPVGLAPDGAGSVPAGTLAGLAPQCRLARDGLDAFVAALAERCVALLDAVGVRVALVDPGAPADATLRAVAPVGSDAPMAVASMLAVAGDEAGASSVARAARAGRAAAASAAWGRASCAVLGRLAPRLYARDDLEGAYFDAAGRLHLGDAFLRAPAPGAAPNPAAAARAGGAGA